MNDEKVGRTNHQRTGDSLLSVLALVLAVITYIVPGGTAAERLVLALAVVGAFLLIWRGIVLASRQKLDWTLAFLMVVTLVLGVSYALLAGSRANEIAQGPSPGGVEDGTDGRTSSVPGQNEPDDGPAPAPESVDEFDAPVRSTGVIVVTPEEAALRPFIDTFTWTTTPSHLATEIRVGWDGLSAVARNHRFGLPDHDGRIGFAACYRHEVWQGQVTWEEIGEGGTVCVKSVSSSLASIEVIEMSDPFHQHSFEITLRGTLWRGHAD